VKGVFVVLIIEDLPSYGALPLRRRTAIDTVDNGPCLDGFTYEIVAIVSQTI